MKPKYKIIKHRWNGQKFYSIRKRILILGFIPFWVMASQEVYDSKEEAKLFINQ